MSTLAIIIFSLVTAVDAGVAQYRYNKYHDTIGKEADKIAKEFANDTEKLNSLIDAYNEGDLKLANSILYSSPVGTRLKTLRQYSSRIKEQRDLTKKELSDKTQQYNTANEELNAKSKAYHSTGSAIGDWISGGTKVQNNLDTSNSYKSSTFKGQTLEEINNGKK